VPQAEIDAVVVDDAGNPCAPGEVGELMIRSGNLAMGEFRDGTLVPGRIMPDPANPSLRIYRSGDLARQTADGVFVVLGRVDRMLKIHGMRVEPTEVEAAIRLLPGVTDAVALPHGSGADVRLVAFVATRGAATDEAALRAHMRAQLPVYMLPSKIVVLDALPRLGGGKVDGQALLAQLEQ
jgi:acyl-coenzyme A synthetase/AMP-(fatty) acid ligase